MLSDRLLVCPSVCRLSLIARRSLNIREELEFVFMNTLTMHMPSAWEIFIIQFANKIVVLYYHYVMHK